MKSLVQLKETGSNNENWKQNYLSFVEYNEFYFYVQIALQVCI